MLKKLASVILFIAGLILLNSCWPSIILPGQQFSETAVMGTVQVILTQSSIGTLIAQLTEVSQASQQVPPTLTPTYTQVQATTTPSDPVETTIEPSQTPLASDTPTPTPVLPTQNQPTSSSTAVPPTQAPPSATPKPPTATNTPVTPVVPTALPSSTPTLTPTAVITGSTYCNWVKFVKDITVPDMTQFGSNMSFTKSWRLRNIGTCTWTTGYSLVYDSGEQMSGPISISLPHNVAPGETIDLSVNLVAPGYPSVYTGYWKLKSDTGQTFGIGSAGNGVFWVQINVKANIHFDYQLFSEFCNAVWTSGSGILPCDGSYNTNSGSVTYITEPVLEGGSARKDQSTLITIPSSGSNGFITGVFPPYHIKHGDHFHTMLGCLDGHPQCELWFTLAYLDANGVSHTLLGPTYHTLDGYMTEVEIDLNPYENTTVQFVLTVQNGGSSVDDYAFWFYPIVWNN
jgi:hypothetical protein